MKKGSGEMNLIVALIIGSMLLLLYFSVVFPRMQSSLNIYSLIGTGCKYPGFYYDVISHNPDYAYEYYEEYLGCNHDDERGILRGWKALGLRPYGAINLIKGYINTGNYGKVSEEIKGESLIKNVEKSIKKYEYFSNELDELKKSLENLPEWEIVVDVNLDIEGSDWGSCDDKTVVIKSTDYDTKKILGIKQGKVIGSVECDGVEYKVWSIETVKSVKITVDGKEAVLPGLSIGSSVVAEPYRLIYDGIRSKSFYFTLEMNNQNVFIEMSGENV